MESNTVQQLVESVQKFERYPTNLVPHLALPLNTEAYVKTLDMHETQLFCSESSPFCHLRFWECDKPIDGFHNCSAKNLEELDVALRRKDHADPKSRFVFVTAPNSRAALNVTRRIAQLLFSWHQVMPSYIDFLVTFGNRHYGNEFPFTGFRQQLRLSETSRGSMINELGRSGKGLSLCFNLRSVEQSTDEWPWALRQTAIYHSFDFSSGRAIWIVTKANKLIEKRIRSATVAKGSPGITQFDTNSRAFSANLLIHLVLVDWVGENWRWYIDFLEEKAQKLTRPILQMSVPRPQYSAPTGPTSPQPPSIGFSNRSSSWRVSKVASEKTIATNKPWSLHSSPRPRSEFFTAAKHRPMSSAPRPEPFENAEEKGFRIEDLQENQFLEDKTNEAMLIIDANLNIVDELLKFYKSTIASHYCPEGIKTSCLPDIERLEARIDAVKSDLRMQLSRAKSIIRLLSDRKNLLFGILEYQSTQASKLLAEKGQISADEMKTMTEDMHDIARKTKQETVSMRIITLVTLFFLPGTFISTLMSTDIIRWQGDSSDKLQKIVSIGALEFFLSMTIPLMMLTFLAWYVVYRYLKHKDQASRLPIDVESEKM